MIPIMLVRKNMRKNLRKNMRKNQRKNLTESNMTLMRQIIFLVIELNN